MRQSAADVTQESRVVKSVLHGDYNQFPDVLRQLISLAPLGFSHPENGQILAAYRASLSNGGNVAAHLEGDHALMLEIYRTSKEVEPVEDVIGEARRLLFHACKQRLTQGLADIESSPSTAFKVLEELASESRNVTSSVTQERWTLNDLLDYDYDHDPNALIGFRNGITTRYLCKGGGSWMIGSCLHKDTPIFDPIDKTVKTVRDRFVDSKPFHVISLKDGIPTIMAAEPPKQFSENPMMKLHFSNGQSIIVTPAHRLLTDRGYEFSFDAAQRLLSGEPVLLPSISDISLSKFHSSVSHCSQTIQGSQVDYPSYPHFDGEPLRQVSSCGPSTPPSPNGAHEHNHDYSRLDDSPVLLEHSHHHQQTFLHSRKDSILRPVSSKECLPHELSLLSFDSLFPSQLRPANTISQIYKVQSPSAFVHPSKAGPCDFHTSEPTPSSSTSLPPSNDNNLSLLPKETGQAHDCNTPKSYPECLVGCPLPNCPIILELVKAEMLPDLHEYYDFFVPETNNYYACGVFHHNSGIGKSSLAIQQAYTWVLDKPFCGILPAVKSLRILIVQNENDIGDCAEVAKGVRNEVCSTEEDSEAIQERTRIVRCRGKTGADFCSWLGDEVSDFNASIVYVDPLLRYAGIDVNRQEQCTRFLNELMDPMLASTGVHLIGCHHTGKPRPKKDTKGWTLYDEMYAGIGSSELVNWARSVTILRVVDDNSNTFELLLAKRGKRAFAFHPDGTNSTRLFLKHSNSSTCWHQVGLDDVPRGTESNSQIDKFKGRPNKSQEIASMNLYSFCADCKPQGEGQREIARRLEIWLSNQNFDASFEVCRRTIACLVANQKLHKQDDGTYIKGKES